MCITQLCCDVPVSSEACICSGYTLLYTYTALVGMVKEVFQESSGVCLHQGCLRALFSSLKTACTASPSVRASTPDLQDLKNVCGYMVNSVFNFLIDTGLCWSPFSLLRPKQKEGKVCFHSQFKGAVRHGSGAEHGSGKKRG